MKTLSLNRRNFLQSAVVGAAAGAVLGAPVVARAANKQFRLRVASSLSTDEYSEHYFWFQRFASNLKASVGDQIRLDYYPNGQLGSEGDTVQQVKTGSIDMMISGSAIWATALPEIGMLDLGYLFDSYEHLKKNLDGAVGQKLTQMIAERSKVSIIGWTSPFGARSIYTKKLVTSLSGIAGMKIRVLPTPVFIQTFEALGATPTPVSMNELYTALQTGIVDGFEHNAPTALAVKLYETTKNCYLSEHMLLPVAAAVSPRLMNILPAELKSAFLNAASEASDYQYAQTPAKVQKAISALQKAGVTFTPMSKSDREAARKVVKDKVWAPFIDKYPLAKPLIAAIDSDRA